MEIMIRYDSSARSEFVFQCLSFEVSRKPPKITNIHDQDDDHLQ